MLPQLVRIKQDIITEEISNVEVTVKNALDQLPFNRKNLVGKTIGITVGSRGISNLSLILKTIVNIIKDAGGNPVLLPAMGTHGGGKVDGQREVLESLGINEATIGAPLRFCVESTLIGETPSQVPVYCNSEALKIDGLVVMNRIKEHTDFSGEIESGICKMFSIGLGGPQGAFTTHAHAMMKGYEKVITEVAEMMIQKLPVIFAVAILENWKGRTAHVEAFLPEDIVTKEKLLLKKYKAMTIKLPFSNLDVLVVGEMGKNISGTGMDTKVIGRIHVKGQKEPDHPKITRIVVLEITPESHGNAIGVGLADIITKKVFNSIDISVTALNSISSMAPEQGFIPCVVNNDQEAIVAAVNTLGAVDASKARIVYIKNTAALDEIVVSEALVEEICKNDQLKIIGELEELQFDKEGNLINLKGE